MAWILLFCLMGVPDGPRMDTPIPGWPQLEPHEPGFHIHWGWPIRFCYGPTCFRIGPSDWPETGSSMPDYEYGPKKEDQGPGYPVPPHEGPAGHGHEPEKEEEEESEGHTAVGPPPPPPTDEPTIVREPGIYMVIPEYEGDCVSGFEVRATYDDPPEIDRDTDGNGTCGLFSGGGPGIEIAEMVSEVAYGKILENRGYGLIARCIANLGVSTRSQHDIRIDIFHIPGENSGPSTFLVTSRPTGTVKAHVVDAPGGVRGTIQTNTNSLNTKVKTAMRAQAVSGGGGSMGTSMGLTPSGPVLAGNSSSAPSPPEVRSMEAIGGNWEPFDIKQIEWDSFMILSSVSGSLNSYTSWLGWARTSNVKLSTYGCDLRSFTAAWDNCAYIVVDYDGFEI